MSRLARTVISALLITAASSAAVPTATAATGAQKFDGVVIASGATGTRHVVATSIVGRGLFKGVGRIVEVQNLPGDPDNIARDDLVFAAGALHLVSTTVAAEFSLDAATCVFSGSIDQTTTTAGGSGRFVNVSGTFTATVTVRALAQRNPDGSCSQDQAPRFEVDALSLSGTMTL
jgi:hypothetical protein